MSKYFPDTKWFAQGLAGLITWGILTALNHWAGIAIPPEQQIPIIGAVSLLLHYLVPASLADKVKMLDENVVKVGLALGKISLPAKIS